MDYYALAVSFSLGAILGGWLMAYIYAAEIERTKQDNKFKDSYIEHMRARFESIRYSQRVKK